MLDGGHSGDVTPERFVVKCGLRDVSTGRRCNLPEGHAGPHNILPRGWITCPRCEGQKYDRGSCGLCGNLGVLDGNGERLPFPAIQPAS